MIPPVTACRRFGKRIRLAAKHAVLFLLMAMPGLFAAEPFSVTIVVDEGISPPAEHGVSVLENSFRNHGCKTRRATTVPESGASVVVLAGMLGNSGPAAQYLKVLNVALPARPEALAIQRTSWQDRPALVLCGADARGLMYAALEVADQVEHRGNVEAALASLRNTVEEPFIHERAVSIYTMHPQWFHQRLHDERHWEKYFALLARSRINNFVVVFGYENGGFMAPLYPYFFETPDFPQVEMVGLTPEQQRQNTSAFQRVIEQAHAHGIDFIPAIWDHIYRGGVQGGGIAGASDLAGQRAPGLVHGVTSENLADYNQAALRKFLDVFPDIDGLQFRMHNESGLKRGEMQGFWHDIFKMIQEQRPHLRVDLRAKELPDAVIQDGLDQGLRLRVATKYWMEQMGLPFHPTHVNPPNQHDRRHGYADLLRYPQQYKVHWRLWNGGTTRLLLWGDPEYARRFVESCQVYGGDSFEVNEMLATWMLGEPRDAAARDILHPMFSYYDYPFERYWHFYQVWGRAGYNPQTAPEVWAREFTRKFGPAVGPCLMKGSHLASQILPRIVAASYRYRLFPTTRGWAEMMRIDDLPEYAQAEGSDVQQFMNPQAAAKSLVEGTDTAMRRPAETSHWFADKATAILHQVGVAEAAAGPNPSREFVSTVADLKILAGLAQYHSHRLPAGVAYNLYRQTGDGFALDDAVHFEEQAVRAWEGIVEAAGNIYSTNLALGAHRVGFPRHWQEELDKLYLGLDRLKAEKTFAATESKVKLGFAAHVPVRRLVPEEQLRLRLTARAHDDPNRIKVWIAEDNGPYQFVPMNLTGNHRFEAQFRPRQHAQRLLYYFALEDSQGRIGALPPNGKDSPFTVRITDDTQPPAAQLERGQNAKPGQNLKVTASVVDSSGVKWVRLRYRHLTQFEDYETLEMIKDVTNGLYTATIPGNFIVPEWDLMYFIEVMDTAGNGRMYPDLEVEMPYVIVRLER